ncbi:hypothetical protein GMA3_19 [Gordonia phage GMA3]|uniref:Minor tail protein n=1 Tax=Gordonia phage GMA3 TaxID=1647284 RepID=A0A0K0NKH5_9CAUD|nr:hypothetical protein AU105_gp019 [Gordonia phage GMA3]AKL88196.1 hypothetical protein GMA3_19 [Gordonia phage GMA3]
MSGLADLYTAQQIDRYIDEKIANGLIKQRPAPKYAIVKSIDTEASIAEVSYIGEDSVVKVPFGVAAPSEIGQEVRIEGVPGDRFIASVRGTTAVEQGISDNADQIEVNKQDITDALLGTYEGDDPILSQLMGWAGSIGQDVSFDALLAALKGEYTGENPVLIAIQNVTKPIRIIFDGAGLIPDWLLPGISIGKLTDNSVNLIADGAFQLPPPTSNPAGSWYHSETGGRGDTGAAAFDANGTAEEILSAPIPSADDLTFIGYARTEGAYAPGSGDTFVVTGYAYDGANVLVETKTLVSGRPGDAWMEFSGTWNPTSSATNIVLGLKATSVLQSGTIFVDDARLSRPQSIPQAWVQNLLDDLQGMFGWIETLVDNLLGSFGLPAIGDLFDRIIDLGDEIADFFGLGQDTAGGLDTLIDKLLHNPLEALGQIPQSLVTGLNTALNNANNFIQNVINVIIQGIKKVPIVGGSIANLLEAVTGLTNTVETTETNVTIVQTQVTAVQEVFSVTSTKPLWTCLDPTADSSFPLAELRQPVPHTHTYGEGSFPSTKTSGSSGIFEFNVTGTQFVGANIRVGESGVRDQISIMARRTGTVNDFYGYAFKMNPDGSFTHLTVTANMASDLTTASSWITSQFDQQVIVEPGDTILIIFSGSGTVSIMGIQTVFPSIVTGFRPRQIGFDIGAGGVVSDPSGNPFISTINADSAYSQKTPYVELGRDIGQAAKRSFFDNFNRSSLGNSWLLGRYDSLNGTSGGSNLTIKSNRVENVSSQLTQQRAWGMYTVPLSTDNISCEVDVTGNDSPECGLMVCASSTQGNFMALSVTESTAVLVTANDPAGNGASIKSTTSNAGAGHWSLTYDIADNTFRAYKNGTQVMQWVDSGNQIKHGQGQRFCGMFIDHKIFNSGPALDNWHAYDIVEA